MAADDLELKSWDPATSACDITEHVEPFTVDSNGYATDTMQYDPAGNLTYDGVEAYTYDAWNRLISVAHAYRDDGGALHTGQVFETIVYDGQPVGSALRTFFNVQARRRGNGPRSRPYVTCHISLFALKTLQSTF